MSAGGNESAPPRKNSRRGKNRKRSQGGEGLDLLDGKMAGIAPGCAPWLAIRDRQSTVAIPATLQLDRARETD